MPSSQTISIILQFAFATLLPAVAGATLTLAFRKTRLANLGYWPQQVLCGIVFGAIAIFGTEFGINALGATMNVRDAAPLAAGLYFGGPAGIIAGLIGGIERWFSVLWGRGMFTRVACSVATCLVGFYAALLNRYLFSNRKPSWPLALACGMVAEVLHLLLVFLTNMDQSTHAFQVVQVCSVPMITCNGLSVALSGALIARTEGERLWHKATMRDISQVIQVGMLGVVAVGFAVTVGFTFALQDSATHSDTVNTLDLALSDVEADIRDASDANLLALTQRAADQIINVSSATNDDLAALVTELDVSEVHVIDGKGIIVASSDAPTIGFDMHSGAQSAAFLDLLPGGRSSYYVQEYQPMVLNDLPRKFAGVRIPGGFIQVSYDATHFMDDLATQVRSSVANRHVGNDGFLAVFGEDGSFVGSRDDLSMLRKTADRIYNATEGVEEGALFETTLVSSPQIAMYRDVEGFRMIALIPQEEAVLARDLAVLVTTFMEVLVFAALFAAIYILISRVVVRSIWQVNGTLDQITSGDLNAEVNVRGSREFSSLSDDINRTVAALREAIAAESARIERDLATAKAIQESALPRTFPPFPEIDAFDLYASMNAAREVGGDFYDFFLVDDHTLGFLIADVSGKGIPASLFMMTAKTELANRIGSGMGLAEAVRTANYHLCQGNDANMFVTVWAATLDWQTGLLTYVNAGHNYPLLRHEGSWTWLDKRSGFFLGTFDTAKYTQGTLMLEPGDELFLYTDGVNEALSPEVKEYGNDRLEAFLAAHASLHPHPLIEAMRADVAAWANGAEQSDDVTMLCLEYGVSPEVFGKVEVTATEEGLDELQLRLHYELAQLACPEEVQGRIQELVEGLFHEICLEAYAGDEEAGRVQLDWIYHARPSALTVSLTNWGQPIEPSAHLHSLVDDLACVHDEDSTVVAFHQGW